MPRPRSPRPCSEPGCPELDCEIHSKRPPDVNRPSSKDRGYNTPEWKRTRLVQLAAHPWCEAPGCWKTATDVDHTDGAGPHGPRGHDPDNLQSLCHRHHSIKTATQDGGFGRKKTSA